MLAHVENNIAMTLQKQVGMACTGFIQFKTRTSDWILWAW